jgi:hypothetical protein
MLRNAAFSTLICCCFDGEPARELPELLVEDRTVALAGIAELTGAMNAIASAVASISKPLLLPGLIKTFSS